MCVIDPRLIVLQVATFHLRGDYEYKESPLSTHINPADSSNSEPNLIARAQHGDGDAFAALFNAHKQRIYAICLRMTNNVAEAEDLTQDAFIHVSRKLSTFRGDSAFSTWLYRIAVNTVLMHFRKKSSSRQISLDQPVEGEAGPPKREYGHVDQRLSGCIDRLALVRAIKELPPGYRMIFLLHEVEGFEHKEIAQLLHCSVGNSKSQLHKAKLKMRELLSPVANVRAIAKARPEMQVATVASVAYARQLDKGKESTNLVVMEDRGMPISAMQGAALSLETAS